jgi:hypothetical protein
MSGVDTSGRWTGYKEKGCKDEYGRNILYTFVNEMKFIETIPGIRAGGDEGKRWMG